MTEALQALPAAIITPLPSSSAFAFFGKTCPLKLWERVLGRCPARGQLLACGL
jgi:hypothetical protein